MSEQIPSLQDQGKEKSFSFTKFLEEAGVSPDDARVPIMKEVWNKALSAASKYFNELEGTDYDIEDALGEK